MSKDPFFFRTESRLVELLKLAKEKTELIAVSGYYPVGKARDVIDYLQNAELIVCKPQGEFQQELSRYQSEMQQILSSAYENACIRHLKENSESVVRDAQTTMSLIKSYSKVSGIEILGDKKE